MLCITLEPYAAIQLDVKILIQFSEEWRQGICFPREVTKGYSV